MRCFTRGVRGRETRNGGRETGDGRRGTGNGGRETGDGRRGTGNGGRETGDGRRETGDGRRGTEDGRRETGNGERRTGDGRRETGDGRRETGDGRRETGDGRRETGDGRRETGDGRRETGDGRRETGDGRRETGDGRRETGDGRRETGDGRRGTHKDSPYPSTQTRVFGGLSLASAAARLRAVVSLGTPGRTLGRRDGLVGRELGRKLIYISSPRVDRRHGRRRLHPVAYAVVLVSWWLLLECSHRTTGLQTVLNPKHRPGVVATRAAR